MREDLEPQGLPDAGIPREESSGRIYTKHGSHKGGSVQSLEEELTSMEELNAMRMFIMEC